MMVETIRQLIHDKALIEAGDHVLLGFSGGPDSLCLFDVLVQLRKELGFTLSCVHVNHGLRPGAAEEDQRFVESLCQERGVVCEVVSADCRAAARSLGLTEEEAGRRLRYEAFVKCADALSAKAAAHGGSVKIAVAQNRQDQAETVLQRLFRGTGTDGLAGMDYCRKENGFAIIRPLLDTDRAAIEAYLAERRLTPRRDLTNDGTDYVRNRIRNELLPQLAAQYNPRIIDALVRAADNAREDSQYLKEQAEVCLWEAQIAAGEVPRPLHYMPEQGASCEAGDGAGAAGSASMLVLDGKTLRQAPLPIRHRVIRRAFAMIGLMQDIAAVHLDAMDELIEGGRTSQETYLPDGYTMRVGYETIECVSPEAAAEPAEEADAQLRTSIRVLSRSELLAEIARQEAQEQDAVSASGDVPDGERIRAYIYSKNFTGVKEASLVLDADKVENLLRTLAPVAAAPEQQETRPLTERITFRTRRAGDRIPLKNGSKSIQDLMVDDKIPRARRGRILLAAAGQTILWVTEGTPKPRYAAGCAAGPETERFLVLEMGIYV